MDTNLPPLAPNPMLLCVQLAGQLWPGLRILADVAHRRRDADHAMVAVVEIYAAVEPHASQVHPDHRRHRRSTEIPFDRRGVPGGVYGWTTMIMTGDGREYEPQHYAASLAWTELAGKLSTEIAKRGTTSSEEHAAHDAAQTAESVARDLV